MGALPQRLDTLDDSIMKSNARQLRVRLRHALHEWKEAIWDINKVIASRPPNMDEVQLALHALYRQIEHMQIEEDLK